MLTDKQLDVYKTNGFLVVENVFDQTTLGQLRNVVDKLATGAAGLTSPTEVYDLEPSHTPEHPRVRRIKTPHKWHPVFWELAKHPKLTSILCSLLGPNVRLHGSKLNMKLPHCGAAVEWHQDWAFYPHTNDDILAVGVMMDDMDDDNGPLLMLPGTHRSDKIWDHHQDGRFCGAIDPSATPDLDYSKAVACTGKAGSCSFHHVRLVHGSAKNNSDKPRQLLLYEVAAADAWPLLRFSTLEEYDSRMICGESTIEPRIERIPIRMPLPSPLAEGSIYENQTVLRNRYFEAKTATI
ncbi:MAG: phytanoyl-CoA dioxygenase family protein [Burkholderiales bacterium]|nr:phytanoyl-CoA dioxygenase family protein [Burkholderiales bacterium]